MKILFVEQKGVYGGGQVFLLDLVTALQNRGHHCIVAHDRNEALADDLARREVRTIGLEMGHIARAKSLVHLFLLLFGRIAPTIRFLRLVWIERPDVVCANDLFSLIAVGPAVRIIGCPLILVSHNTSYPHGFLTKRAIGLADSIVAVTEAVRKHILEMRPDRSPVIRVLSLGLPPANRSTRRRNGYVVRRRARSVGYVGRLSKEKGIDILLRAFALLLETNNGVKLIVVGNGPEEGAAKDGAVQLGIERHVEWLGFRDDVEDCMRLMDVLVIPSRSEGLPYVLLEAMRLGLPVVATRVGGIPDIVTDKENGAIVDPENYAAISHALEEVLRSHKDRARYSVAGRKLVSRQFDFEHSVGEYETLFFSLTRRRS